MYEQFQAAHNLSQPPTFGCPANRLFPRNHRQRKEIYTKALEQELDTLREQARLTKQLLDCEAENQLLRELAISNGLTLPPARRTGEPHATVVQVSISGDPGPQQHMCAQSCQGPQLQTAISGHFGAHTLSSSGSSPLMDDSVLYLGNNATAPPLDIVSAGFDFVFMYVSPHTVKAKKLLLFG
jgi:hypothetical protein